MLTQRAREALVCPLCRSALIADGDRLTCARCAETYRRSSTQVDLRPPHARVATLELEVGGPADWPPRALFQPLRADPDARYPVADADLGTTRTYGNRLTRELLSHFPVVGPEGGLMLDLGSGEGQFRDLIPATGLDYVSLDTDGDEADVLGDAHALPFRDGSFSFVLAMSVVEHLRFPRVAMREVRRVLRPGGRFIGSVAFMEPFHLDSYFHHSHLATYDVLRTAGFDVIAIAPSVEWAGVRPMAEMSLFAGAPRPRAVGRLAAWPLSVAHRGWWRARAMLGRASELDRRLEVAGGFRFVADAPAG
jgi:SAM-dependent methyltransferase